MRMVQGPRVGRAHLIARIHNQVWELSPASDIVRMGENWLGKGRGGCLAVVIRA